MRAATVRASARSASAAGPPSRWATAGTPASPPWRTRTSRGIPPKYSRSFCSAKRSPPPRPKISVASPQCGQTNARHVLDDAHDGHAQPAEHRERLGHVQQRHVLRRRHQHCAADRDRLGQCQLGVGGARRQVHHQVVEVAPLHVAEELLDRTADQRAAPDDRLPLGHEELDRDDLHPVPLERHDLVVGAGDRLPLHAEHQRDVGARDVGVDQPHAGAVLRQRDGEVGRHGALADAALSRRDRDDVLDAGQELLGLDGRRPPHVAGPRHGDLAGTRSLERGSRVALDLVLERACRRRQLDGERDVAAIGDDDVLDHVQRDDVAPELRLLDGAERVEHAAVVEFVHAWRSGLMVRPSMCVRRPGRRPAIGREGRPGSRPGTTALISYACSAGIIRARLQTHRPGRPGWPGWRCPPRSAGPAAPVSRPGRARAEYLRNPVTNRYGTCNSRQDGPRLTRLSACAVYSRPY